MPDVDAFKVTVTNLNNGLSATSTAVTDVKSKFTSLINAMDSFPRPSALYIPLDYMQTNLTSFDFSGIVTILTNLNTSLANIPDFKPLKVEITKVTSYTKVIPCTDRMVATIKRLNYTLLKLPDAIGSAISMVDGMKGQLNSTIDQISGVSKSLDDVTAQMNSAPDFGSTIKSINDMTKKKNDVLSGVDLSGAISSLKTLEQNLTSGSIDKSVLTKADNVTAALSNSNAKPSASTMASLDTLKAQSTSAPPQLQSALDAINKWEKGFCVNTPAT